MFGMTGAALQGTKMVAGTRTTRCPVCQTAMLNTARIFVRVEKRTYFGLPIKACYRCKVIIHLDRKGSGWKLWNGDGLVE